MLDWWTSSLIVLGLCGITIIITNSYIFAGLRNRCRGTLQVFIHCSQCVGFWAGFIGYIVFYFDMREMMNIYFWLYGIVHGGAVSILSLVLSTMISK